MSLNLRHQTAAEFAARYWRTLQEEYAAKMHFRYHYMIWWIWNQIQLGNLTSDQVRQSYNAYFNKTLNTTQWNSLVTTRFIPIKDRYLSMLAEGLV